MYVLCVSLGFCLLVFDFVVLRLGLFVCSCFLLVVGLLRCCVYFVDFVVLFCLFCG